MTHEPPIGRRDSDAWLATALRHSRKWFVGLIAANVISAGLLIFHVGMWRHQAETQERQQTQFVATMDALKRQVDAQGREISRLAGVIEGRQQTSATRPGATDAHATQAALVIAGR